MKNKNLGHLIVKDVLWKMFPSQLVFISYFFLAKNKQNMAAFPKQQVDLAEFDGAFEIPVPRWNQGKDVFLGSLFLNKRGYSSQLC